LYTDIFQGFTEFEDWTIRYRNILKANRCPFLRNLMSQPIDTTVTLEDQFAVVDPISSAPPGSDIEAYVEEGVVQLPLGGQVVTVTFLTPKVSPDYQFDVRDIYNMVDATPLVIDCILTNFTVTGFEITLSASPDTGNYYFRWKVRIPTAIQSGITITAQVAGIAGGSVQEVFATGNDGVDLTVGGDATKLPNVIAHLIDGGIPLAKLAETVVTGPVLTPTGAQTVTNKLLDGNNNTFQNIGLASLIGDGIIAQNLTDPLSDQPLYWNNTSKEFEFRGTPAARGMAKDVYLSARSDGKDGTGAPDDPFDASGTNFDAILADNTKTPVNTRIHLIGTGFQTNPITRTWHLRDGWNIGGSGIDVTTVTNVAVGDGVTFYSPVTLGDDGGGTVSNGVHIHDLTVDSNGTFVASSMATLNSEKNVRVEHIWICGSNNTIERVRGLHQYGSLANGVESFGFIISVPTGGGKNNHILDCDNVSPVGNYGAPFTMFGFNSSHPISNSSVEDCYAEASDTGAVTPFRTGGVNLANIKNCKIKNNVFVDCLGVAYCDTGTVDGVKIDGNTAIRCWSGVEFNISSGTPRRIEVTDNTLFVQNRAPGGGRAYGILFGTVQTSATDIKILANKQYYTNDGSGFDEFSSIRVVNAVNASAVNNITDPTSFGDTSLTGTGLFVTGNRKHDGSVLPELPDAASGDRLWVGGGTPSGYGTGDIVARRSSVTGQIYFGDWSGNQSIYHDGTNFNIYGGSWLPDVDAIRNLGSASQRWDGLHLSGLATISSLSASRLVATEGSKTLTSVTPQSTTGTTAGFTAASGTAVLAGSTFTGGAGTAYTIGDVVLALKTIGALAP
jgi:hypothetical protein